MLVGDDPASHLYVSLKQKRAQEVGIRLTVQHIPRNTSQQHLLETIQAWNQDSRIDAILIQLPLPPEFDESALIASMDPQKDADGFHPNNQASIFNGTATSLPPLHEGILRLINQTPIKLSGTRAALLGNSEVFIAPLKHMLALVGCSVEIFQGDKIERADLTEADIIVTAVGRPHFLQASMTKDHAIIIDVGTTRKNKKTYGDVDLESFASTDAWITPVPGGVGPMTIAMLLQRVLALATKKR